MNRLLLVAWLLLLAPTVEAQSIPEWLLASTAADVAPGGRFQLLVVAPAGTAPPERLALRVKSGEVERRVELRLEGDPAGSRAVYSALMPAAVAGPVMLDLAGRPSSLLAMRVAARPADAVDALTSARAPGEAEPPLSDYDPMYLVFGAREGYSARFQLSFKYRLFDYSAGLGREQPWLAGFYFGYTQTSLWDLSSQSKPFRDTSYRPALFWRWERSDEKTWLDGLRAGVEHESNGRDGARSRSIDILFAQPSWRWSFADGARLEFSPKLYGYLDKDDNPDIDRYRGHVDWKLRHDTGHNWSATGIARLGRSGKGSVQVDLARRARDLKFGPVSGYLYAQLFTGYGEDILDYNQRRKSQLRLGFAIVP